MDAFSRLELAIGKEKLHTLKEKTVVIIGVGGVGSFAAEAIARSAIGRIVLIDYDVIDITNINRQIHALTNNIGEIKVNVMASRIKEINSDCEVIPLNIKFDESTIELVHKYNPDYIIDAIDDLKSKVLLIQEAKKIDIPIISSMGTANKLDPTQLTVTDISKTYMDPVAKIVRQRLRKLGIEKNVKVVFSAEKPLEPINKGNDGVVLSSNSFVPASAGLLMASVVVRDLCSYE